MANEKKKKPRPWDKPDEDIPDVIWGGGQNTVGGFPGFRGRNPGDPGMGMPLPNIEFPFPPRPQHG